MTTIGKNINTNASLASVYSMTGFGSAQQEVDNATGQVMVLNLEIRSVNSRFLDLTFKIPEELRAQEIQWRQYIGGIFKRGKIEIKLQLQSLTNKAVVEPSESLLQQLNQLQSYVQSWLPKAKDLSVSDVLRLAESNDHLHFDYSKVAFNLLQQACKQLQQSRQTEGQRLKLILLEKVEQLLQLAKQAQPLIPHLVQQQQEKFLQRWQDALNQVSSGNYISDEVAQERALSEAATFAIRIDVAEELNRLQSHIQEILQLLNGNEPVGKRLDFMIQELHREANTLGSKSALLELSKISVEMKVLIEQMREQVQNLE